MTIRRSLSVWLALLSFLTAAAETRADCVTDSTTTDFAAGTLGTCYSGERMDGEVLLAPTVGEEFSGGPGLPAGWVLADWDSGTGTVGGGALSANGVRVNTDPTTYGPGRALEFVATFGADTFQHVGFGEGDNTTLLSGIFGATARQWAMFSTKDTSNTVYVRSNDGSNPELFDSVATVDGIPHRYRIEWSGSQVDYYIDGVFKKTHSITIAGPMRPAISDVHGGMMDPPLAVDWVRLTPYASSCTYDSVVFDGGSGADWTTLTAGTSVPGGAALTIQTRSGNSAVPDISWSAFQALSGGTTIQSPIARYLQYRVILSTGDADVTPELEDAEVCHNACTVTGPETCDGVDNDCNGQIDEGTDGTPCDTGVPGVCAASTSVCNAGVLQCPQVIFPGTETCNNLDDDCNGATDEGTGGASCNTGVPGVCAASTQVCSGGTLTCPQTTFPSPETCNNLDDNCNGVIDDGTGGAACNTGVPGICAAGTQVCSGGTLTCPQTIFPGTETCNGSDDDCDGQVDEGTGGAPCNSGVPGICAPSTQVCSGGALQCPQTIFPGTETCNNLDDNCNGAVDEGTGGSPCVTGLAGVCSPGTNQCQSGSLVCVQNTSSGPETCNSMDDDCDGPVDEGDPGGGGACTTGNPGVCSAGVQHCLAGSVQCMQTSSPTTETCNNLDDDCDGTVDDGNPGGGGTCDTGLIGICGPGIRQCLGGNIVCQSNLSAVPEACNGADDNCNGSVDEGNPGGGVACVTGQMGVCAAGTTQCQSPTIVCLPNTPASTELCATGLDENCNGTSDEEPCQLCTAAKTVTNGAQTKTVLVKLKSTANLDKIIAKGSFVLPTAGLIDPAASSVTVRIGDNTGRYYLGTIPASAFVGSSNGRSFKFSDTSPYGFDGMQHAIIKISGGDLTTTKYLFKARDLELPAFGPGTGTITVRVGDRCFEDDADACTVSSSGSKAKCE